MKLALFSIIILIQIDLTCGKQNGNKNYVKQEERGKDVVQEKCSSNVDDPLLNTKDHAITDTRHNFRKFAVTNGKKRMNFPQKRQFGRHAKLKARNRRRKVKRNFRSRVRARQSHDFPHRTKTDQDRDSETSYLRFQSPEQLQEFLFNQAGNAKHIIKTVPMNFRSHSRLETEDHHRFPGNRTVEKHSNFLGQDKDFTYNSNIPAYYRDGSLENEKSMESEDEHLIHEESDLPELYQSRNRLQFRDNQLINDKSDNIRGHGKEIKMTNGHPGLKFAAMRSPSHPTLDASHMLFDERSPLVIGNVKYPSERELVGEEEYNSEQRNSNKNLFLEDMIKLKEVMNHMTFFDKKMKSNYERDSAETEAKETVNNIILPLLTKLSKDFNSSTGHFEDKSRRTTAELHGWSGTRESPYSLTSWNERHSAPEDSIYYKNPEYPKGAYSFRRMSESVVPQEKNAMLDDEDTYLNSKPEEWRHVRPIHNKKHLFQDQMPISSPTSISTSTRSPDYTLPPRKQLPEHLSPRKRPPPEPPPHLEYLFHEEDQFYHDSYPVPKTHSNYISVPQLEPPPIEPPRQPPPPEPPPVPDDSMIHSDHNLNPRNKSQKDLWLSETYLDYWRPEKLNFDRAPNRKQALSGYNAHIPNPVHPPERKTYEKEPEIWPRPFVRFVNEEANAKLPERPSRFDLGPWVSPANHRFSELAELHSESYQRSPRLQYQQEFEPYAEGQDEEFPEQPKAENEPNSKTQLDGTTEQNTESYTKPETETKAQSGKENHKPKFYSQPKPQSPTSPGLKSKELEESNPPFEEPLTSPTTLQKKKKTTTGEGLKHRLPDKPFQSDLMDPSSYPGQESPEMPSTSELRSHDSFRGSYDCPNPKPEKCLPYKSLSQNEPRRIHSCPAYPLPPPPSPRGPFHVMPFNPKSSPYSYYDQVRHLYDMDRYSLPPLPFYYEPGTENNNYPPLGMYSPQRSPEYNLYRRSSPPSPYRGQMTDEFRRYPQQQTSKPLRDRRLPNRSQFYKFRYSPTPPLPPNGEGGERISAYETDHSLLQSLPRVSQRYLYDSYNYPYHHPSLSGYTQFTRPLLFKPYPYPLPPPPPHGYPPPPPFYLLPPPPPHDYLTYGDPPPSHGYPSPPHSNLSPPPYSYPPHYHSLSSQAYPSPPQLNDYPSHSRSYPPPPPQRPPSGYPSPLPPHPESPHPPPPPPHRNPESPDPPPPPPRFYSPHSPRASHLKYQSPDPPPPPPRFYSPHSPRASHLKYQSPDPPPPPPRCYPPRPSPPPRLYPPPPLPHRNPESFCPPASHTLPPLQQMLPLPLIFIPLPPPDSYQESPLRRYLPLPPGPYDQPFPLPLPPELYGQPPPLPPAGSYDQFPPPSDSYDHSPSPIGPYDQPPPPCGPCDQVLPPCEPCSFPLSPPPPPPPCECCQQQERLLQKDATPSRGQQESSECTADQDGSAKQPCQHQQPPGSVCQQPSETPQPQCGPGPGCTLPDEESPKHDGSTTIHSLISNAKVTPRTSGPFLERLPNPVTLPVPDPTQNILSPLIPYVLAIAPRSTPFTSPSTTLNIIRASIPPEVSEVSTITTPDCEISYSEDISPDKQKTSGKPCKIDGKWLSKLQGAEITICTLANMTLAVNVESTCENNEIHLKEFCFTGTTRHPLGGPFVIVASHPEQEIVHTFVGQCRIYKGEDTIFGQWTTAKAPCGPDDLFDTIETKSESLKRTCKVEPVHAFYGSEKRNKCNMPFKTNKCRRKKPKCICKGCRQNKTNRGCDAEDQK